MDDWFEIHNELKRLASVDLVGSDAVKDLDKRLAEFQVIFEEAVELVDIDAGLITGFHESTLTRAINLEYLQAPFWHERAFNSRFTHASRQDLPALYFAKERETALKEKRPYENQNLSWVMLQSEVKVSRLLDLTTHDRCKSHGIGQGLLNVSWEFVNALGCRTYSQALGHLIAESDLLIEGFLYDSVQDPGRVNLVVFPKNMLLTSYIRLNPTDGEKRTLDRFADEVETEVKGKVPVPTEP